MSMTSGSRFLSISVQFVLKRFFKELLLIPVRQPFTRDLSENRPGSLLSTPSALELAMSRCSLNFAVFLIGIVGLCSGRLSAANLPSGFVLTSVGGYWDNRPVGIIFDETGTMYEWDRDGRVWVFQNDERLAEPLIDLRNEVGNWDDHGMLGFTLDPNFRQNGYIYLMYVVDYHHLAHYGSPEYSPSVNEYYRATIGRISRYTAKASDGFRSVDVASRKVLVGENVSTGIPILSNQHGVGTLLFGSDGTLLASCGDATLPGDYGSHADTYYAQALSESIIKPKENIGMFRSQLPDSLNGKVLRIDASTGDGIPSNPFFDPADPRAARSRVWALGLRNPFRMTLRPGTGHHSPADADPGVLCIGDVGADTWEELDIATGPGMNFGWPIFEGFSPGFDDGNPPNQDARNPLFGTNDCAQEFFTFRDLLKEATPETPSWVNPCDVGQQIPSAIRRFVHTRPALDWKHGNGPARTGVFTGTTAAVVEIGAAGSPVAGPQFGGNCSVGGTWYLGNQFPIQYNNTYFHADFGGSWIRSITFNSNNQPVSVRNFATGVDSVALATDPINGALYYVDIYEGINKISYGGNAPPKAVASADLTFGPGPLTVHFTGSGSTDPEGLPLTYVWNFGDGSPLSTNANPVHLFSAPAGIPTGYTVSLIVTDSDSATNVTTLVISLNNTPPIVTITSPTNGTLYPLAGSTVFNLNASVTDAEYSDSQLLYQWETILHHNNHEHRHPVDTNHITTTVVSPVGCDGNTYFYRIILTVTDPAGLLSRAEVALYPDCTANHPQNLVVQNLGNGSYQIRAYGFPGQDYLVQYTASLLNPVWQTLITNSPGSLGFFEFVDAPNPLTSARFYRSVTAAP